VPPRGVPQGDISLDLLLPVGCETFKPYQRLMIEGLVPVGIVLLAAIFSTGLGVARHLRGICTSDGHSHDHKESRRNKYLKDRHLARKPRTMLRAMVDELGGSLPWLLPFSYLCSTSIAMQAFRAFDCLSFGTDAASPRVTRSYLASDLRVLCDPSDLDYLRLQQTAIVLIACMSALPILYFILVFQCREAIRTHSPSKLSCGCRFLWAEYKPDMWWFETVQQLRKLFLTGYVMLFDKSFLNARLIAALVVTFMFRELADFRDPFRDVVSGRLFELQQMMLVVIFITGFLLRLCDDPVYGQDLCRSIGFEDAFGLSLFCVIWILVLFGVVVTLIVVKLLEHSNSTTLRLKNGKEPTLTLAPEHSYHTFVSHIWSSGQDQAAVIKRQLEHLLPTSKVFLDVDDLVEIGDLENYVRSTQCMLLFLSKGYFCSRKCGASIRTARDEPGQLSGCHPAQLPARDTRHGGGEEAVGARSRGG
jgi:hypothetical protein